MQTVPVETARLPEPWMLDNRTEATEYKISVNQEREERNSMPLTGKDSGTSSRCERDSFFHGL